MSLAIINSSFVGIIYTFTLESDVEIHFSTPFTSFSFASISTPNTFKYSPILSRVSLPLSPTPPLKVSTSSPPSDTIYCAIYCATLYACESRARRDLSSFSA